MNATAAASGRTRIDPGLQRLVDARAVAGARARTRVYTGAPLTRFPAARGPSRASKPCVAVR